MASVGRAEPLRGRLDGFDGRYHYLCERGHHSVCDAPFLDTCTAPIYDNGNLAVLDPTEGTPCGADIEIREVHYRGEGDVL